MYFFEIIGVAFSNLWGNKLRSFLTMLGIIIGISSVITIVAIGEGSQAAISEEFERFGTNRVYIGVNWRENPRYADYFDDNDIETVLRVFQDEVKAASPAYFVNAEAKSGRNTEKVYLQGVNYLYNQIENFTLIKGRFLTETDYLGGRNVAVINKKLAMDLFKRSNVIGEKIIVDTGYSRSAFLVIGVYEMPESALSNLAGNFEEQPTYFYLPLTALRKMGYANRYSSFQINVSDRNDVEMVAQNIINVLERRHRNTGENLYRFESAQSQMEMVDNVLGIVSKVIGAIAAISLVVGGIGVMNIMLVSVTERTREIGIRKAIGARKRDILIQFLIEAMIISGIGGLIGTVIGLTLATIVALALGMVPKISLAPLLTAIAFSAGVGIFFGIYPANKAAKLDPIEALRYE